MTEYGSISKAHKEKDPGLELSVGQVLAAAGATVLGAVLAKLLNLWGTIPGSAFLSVFSTIGSVLILRALRRTGDRVKGQIQAMALKHPAHGTAVTVEIDPGGTKTKATAKVPESAISAATGDLRGHEKTALEPETHVVKSSTNKRTLLAVLVSSVLVFSLTVGALYLFGALTGDPGRFITTVPDPTTTADTQTPADDDTTYQEPPSETPSETPSEHASPSETPSTTEVPSGTPSAWPGQSGSETTPAPLSTTAE